MKTNIKNYLFNNSIMKKFKDEKDLEERMIEVHNIRKKYPDRIPIICERQGTTIQNVDKTKFLVPRDLTMGQFLYVIRKRICLLQQSEDSGGDVRKCET